MFDTLTDIFETLQRDLEKHTEMLANLVENKPIKTLFADNQKILNQTKVAEKLAASLLNAASDWNVS